MSEALSTAGTVAVGRRLGPWELFGPLSQSRLFQLYRAGPAGGAAPQQPPYVLKRLRPEWEEHPEAVELVRREALVGRTVSHPHLMAVLAAQLHEPPYFVVMPWLAGTTLDQFPAGTVDVPQALWIVRQVAEALDALEKAGWTHGDVKPSNVLVSPEGHVTLLDLGFARRPHEEGSVAKRCFLGTIHYIAPERIVSAWGADIRSDIYSLGVVLYQLLCGRLPFEAEDLGELAAAHRQTRPADVRRFAPHVPAAVAALLRQMLAKDPLRRPQSSQELIDRLVALEIATFGQRLAV